jgi:prepilin-type N-terminal cleavage/methylation domain-containing protein
MKRSNLTCRRSDARAGFTLIELLAAVFVTGLCVITVLPFLNRLLGRAWSGEANMIVADQWMQATARLAADLQEAIPLTLDQSDKPSLAFRANERHVIFVHRALAGNRDQLETVTLTIASAANGWSVIRSASLFSKDRFGTDSDGKAPQTSILTTPYRLRFKTLDADHNPLTDDSKVKELPTEVELDVDANGNLPDVPFVFPIAARYPLSSLNQASAIPAN